MFAIRTLSTSESSWCIGIRSWQGIYYRYYCRQNVGMPQCKDRTCLLYMLNVNWGYLVPPIFPPERANPLYFPLFSGGVKVLLAANSWVHEQLWAKAMHSRTCAKQFCFASYVIYSTVYCRCTIGSYRHMACKLSSGKYHFAEACQPLYMVNILHESCSMGMGRELPSISWVSRNI